VAAGTTTAGASITGAAAAGATEAGASAAGAVDTGVTAAGAVAAGAVCEVTAFVGTVSVTLVADPPVCSITAPEGVPGAGGGSVCGWPSSFNFCSKAARAAAWAVVSSARTEMKLAPRATQKPNKIRVLMK
jgi:hypothetical protein